MLNLATVRIHDRVARIFPAHILVTLRGAGFVFLESVAIEIAITINPVQATYRDLSMITKQTYISQPFSRFMQNDEIERGGIRGAVVRRVRNAMEMREVTEF